MKISNAVSSLLGQRNEKRGTKRMALREKERERERIKPLVRCY